MKSEAFKRRSKGQSFQRAQTDRAKSHRIKFARVSDAALAIQAISQGSCGGEIGHLIQGILEAKSSFTDCSFRHVNRAFNGAAHELAQYAKWNNASHVWKDVFPLFLNSLFHSVLS